jgi:hypothetical protein
MKIHARFCSHLRRNSLHICRAESVEEDTSCTEEKMHTMRNTLVRIDVVRDSNRAPHEALLLELSFSTFRLCVT